MGRINSVSKELWVLYMDDHSRQSPLGQAPTSQYPAARPRRLNHLPKTVIGKLESGFRGWRLWLLSPLSHCVSPEGSPLWCMGPPILASPMPLLHPPMVGAGPSGPGKLLGLLV